MNQTQKETQAAEQTAADEQKAPKAPASPAPQPDPSPLELPDLSKKEKRRKWIKRLAAAVAVLALFAGYRAWRGGKQDSPDSQAVLYEDVPVERQNITETLTGSGSLSPADSYVMTTLVSGDILEAPFEEGDMVQKGDALYQVDHDSVTHSLEQSQLSLQQSQRGYSQALEKRQDLQIKATRPGQLISLDVKLGDTVSAGQQIGMVRNSGVMQLTLPFNEADAANFALGQPALVTLDGSFEVLQGTVTTIGASQVLGGGQAVRQVTIDVVNPGAVASGQSATAVVGGAACNSGGTFDYADEAPIIAMMGGDVQQIYVQEGDQVYRDQMLVQLYSKDLEDQIANSQDAVRSAQLALEGQTDQLGDYVITSPISGTIIEKNYKAGDKLEVGKALCTVFDLSYLKMTMNVDELDISKVKEGQVVQITADAVEGKTYTGVVTKININGTSNNGVTSYPVSVRIDDFEGLLPGMNVDASIQVETRENVLAVPVGAVARGNRVLVKKPEAAQPEKQDKKKKEEQQPSEDGAPAGYEYRQVELGITDQSYIEILSGLEEGEILGLEPGGGMDEFMTPPMGGVVVVG